MGSYASAQPYPGRLAKAACLHVSRLTRNVSSRHSYLNRLLGCRLEDQAFIFSYFAAALDKVGRLGWNKRGRASECCGGVRMGMGCPLSPRGKHLAAPITHDAVIAPSLPAAPSAPCRSLLATRRWGSTMQVGRRWSKSQAMCVGLEVSPVAKGARLPIQSRMASTSQHTSTLCASPFVCVAAPQALLPSRPPAARWSACRLFCATPQVCASADLGVLCIGVTELASLLLCCWSAARRMCRLRATLHNPRTMQMVPHICRCPCVPI